MTICGPMMAAKTPPASTHEMALALKAARRVVGRGEAVLLDEGVAQPHDQKPDGEQPEIALEERKRGHGKPPSAVTSVPLMKPVAAPEPRISAAAGRRRAPRRC
jgi:hypothetical protein